MADALECKAQGTVSDAAAGLRENGIQTSNDVRFHADCVHSILDTVL